MNVRFSGSAARAAFTLVELLTVVAIIGILMSILFPAVQAVRSAARRHSCLNNLRQIMIATQNFEATNQHLPTTGAEFHWRDIDSASAAYEEPVAGSVLTSLLPYLSQTPLYEELAEELNDGETVGDRLQALSNTLIEGFYCAASDENFWLTNTTVDSGARSYTGEYTSHYYGISGPLGQGRSTNQPAEVYPSQESEYSELTHGSDASLPEGGRISLEGVFAPNRMGTYSSRFAIDLDDIQDGMSNTLAFAEGSRSFQAVNGDNPINVGWAFGAQYSGTIAEPILERTYSGKSFQFRINQVSTSDHPAPVFSDVNTSPINSNHPSGAQFALADGSCRFINDSVNEDVLKIWMSINGREKQNADDLRAN